MKKDKVSEMQPEYDFSKGVRGKYTKRYSKGTNMIIIDPDLCEYFPDQDSVNKALRGLVKIIKDHEKVES